jgi:ATP/maltotriose-dependent transcriptional regulator MalT
LTQQQAQAAVPEQRLDTDPTWLLRARGCWEVAAALLADTPPDALTRAELLTEAAFFRGTGWIEAENALRQAEAVAGSPEQRASAACTRGFLAYASTVQQVHDRLDEAQAALGRASALLPPEAPLRPLLDFRRGLIAQLLLGDPVSARAAYRRAHAGAEQQQDLLLLSYTWRHLASIAQQDGNLAGARHGFAESLRLREETGFTVGIAPALTALADVSPAPEAAQLRAEAARLVRALGGLPFWLDVSSTG